jgi:hypothetical protein
MSSGSEEGASIKAGGCTKKSSSKLEGNHVSDLDIDLCPFQAFRICNDSCKYYICHGRPDVIRERISKGYANEYLKSVLF